MPKPTSDKKAEVKTTVRLAAGLWEQARKAAIEDRTSFQEMVERALRDHLAARARRLR